MGNSDGVSLGNGKCKAQTDKAILVELDEAVASQEKLKAIWIPQSCIHSNSEVWKYNQKGNVVVALWWAEERGFA
jgi:hypothetical protein